MSDVLINNVLINDVVQFMSEFAPPALAEDWDNVGLLVGDVRQPVTRLMSCLTLTPDVADEAVQRGAEMIVSHHPLPFRPLKRITTETVTGQVLLKLLKEGVAIHSPHTSFDSAQQGINQRIATGLGLLDICPLRPFEDSSDGLGAGRVGRMSQPVLASELIEQVKAFFSIDGVYRVGSDDRKCQVIGVACGAAGEFLADALAAQCDAFITGESNFHTCLQARADKIELILPGHYATERFAIEALAGLLSERFPSLTCWASEVEADPLSWA